MLKIEQLSVSFGQKKVLEDLTYTFSDRQVSALVGESGIGKTTLLHVLGGLIPPTSGKIHSSYQRLAFVFQEARLFPWMTALENVATVCQNRKTAEEVLGAFLPDSDAWTKYPHELSGGMKQRVSIARALAYEPDLLFLDEPFKGLDTQTRKIVSEEAFSRLEGTTVLMITHDAEDLAYCHQILRLEDSPVSHLILEKTNNLSD